MARTVLLQLPDLLHQRTRGEWLAIREAVRCRQPPLTISFNAHDDSVSLVASLGRRQEGAQVLRLKPRFENRIFSQNGVKQLAAGFA